MLSAPLRGIDWRSSCSHSCLGGLGRSLFMIPEMQNGLFLHNCSVRHLQDWICPYLDFFCLACKGSEWFGHYGDFFLQLQFQTSSGFMVSYASNGDFSACPHLHYRFTAPSPTRVISGEQILPFLVSLEIV